MMYENGMYDTEMMIDDGMQNYVNGDMEDGSGYDGADDGILRMMRNMMTLITMILTMRILMIPMMIPMIWR